MLPLTASLVFSLKSNFSPSQFNLICNIKKKLKGGNPLALYIKGSYFEPKNFHLSLLIKIYKKS